MWIISYLKKEKNKPKPTINNIKYITQGLCNNVEVEMFLKMHMVLLNLLEIM